MRRHFAVRDLSVMEKNGLRNLLFLEKKRTPEFLSASVTPYNLVYLYNNLVFLKLVPE